MKLNHNKSKQIWVFGQTKKIRQILWAEWLEGGNLSNWQHFEDMSEGNSIAFYSGSGESFWCLNCFLSDNDLKLAWSFLH